MRGLLGILVFTLICWALSSNRKNIDWRGVAACMGLQWVMALLILKTPALVDGFNWIAGFFVTALNFSKTGANFLFGELVNAESFGYIFAFQVLPTIVFFSALTAALYHLGILQKVIYGFAWLFSKTLKVSGSESLSVSGNIFLGQTESPLLIRPYLKTMARSELFVVMVGGMATIAGGVLAAYVGFLGGPDPVQQQIFATHLLCASVISAPAALMVSKILEPREANLSMPKIQDYQMVPTTHRNILEALSQGTQEGASLALNVGAILLVFTAIMAMLNFGIGAMGSWVSLDDLSLQKILGWGFSPFAWLMGVDSRDLFLVGQLLGEKTILNEFYAYASLAREKSEGLFHSEKSIIVATYALCGFANFSSIGIQIGGIGSLAPERRGELAQMGIKALIGGTIAAFLTACIASVLL